MRLLKKIIYIVRWGFRGNIATSTISSKVKLGKDHIFLNATISGKDISIGDYSSIADNSQILSKFKSIEIGKRVSVGPNVLIQNYTHNQNFLITNYKGLIDKYGEEEFQNIMEETSSPISIGDDVWIGANCVIFPGTKIGAGTIIGANSTVKGDIPSMQIWAGSPAKLILKRNIS